MSETDPDDPKYLAGIEFLGHTGAKSFELRLTNEDPPDVYIAIVKYERGGEDTFSVAASLDPTVAVMRLCEQVTDGGKCNKCGRPSGFSPEPAELPLEKMICWYQWDPELKVIRPGCGGEDHAQV